MWINLRLVQLVGRFRVFFLSHAAPGFSLRFYFHLCTWVVHWVLLLRLPWRTWLCPCEGQVWRWCSCLGHRGSGSTRYSGGWRLGQQEIQCPRRVWQAVLANTLQYSCLQNPLTEKPGSLQSTVSQRVGHDRSSPAHIDTRLFFACGSSAPVRVELEGGAVVWLVGTLAEPSVQGHGCLCPRSHVPIRIFFQASCSWRSEGLFGQSSSGAPPVQALRGLPCLGSFSVVQRVRHI